MKRVPGYRTSKQRERWSSKPSPDLLLGTSGTEHSINPRAHCPRMKMLKWWEKSHIPKAGAAPIPKRPELLEEPKTPQESAAEPLPASVAGKTLGWAAALGDLQRALVRKEAFQD